MVNDLFGFAPIGRLGARQPQMGTMWHQFPSQPDGLRNRLMADQQEMAYRLNNDLIAYQQAMRRARPIIAQWSEWEQQTRNPAWR